MKLIAIDLDGTLLDSDKKVSYQSKKYLEQLKEEGNIIVIATGRNFKSAFLATDGAFFANYIVSSAGSVIYDNMNRRVLMRATIPFEIAQKILGLYHSNVEYMEFIDLFDYNRFSINDNLDVQTELSNMYSFLENKKNLSHITIGFKDDSTALEVYEYIAKKFPYLNSYPVRCHYTKKICIEIVKKGVSKYRGICEIAKIHGIKNEDIIAFGDSENDLSMIKQSGVGVAMGNAFDIVRENAAYVTKTNDEDGVIEFLKYYL